MTETQARTAVAALAVVLASAIAALIWGSAAVGVVHAVAIIWLLYYCNRVLELVDEARDDADLAKGKAEAIEYHLSGLEPEGAGRHAHRAA